MDANLTFWGVQLWAGLALFARLSAMVMLMPGVGEALVPANVRLAIALLLTLTLAPALAPVLPPQPESFAQGVSVIVGETLIGLMLGAAARLLMATLSTAGQIIGMETGLAFAQTADPTQAQAGQILSAFLGLLGATLVFATDLHHVFLRGVVGSYTLFSGGETPSVADAADLAVSTLSQSFVVAMQISAPVILAGFVFRAGLAVLTRLVPQIQVFFISVEINLLGGFMILALSLSVGVLIWLDRMQSFALDFR